MSGHAEKRTHHMIPGKLIHFLFSVGVFFYFWLLFRYGTVHNPGGYGIRYNYYAAAGYSVLLYWFNRTYNAYLLGYARIRSLVFGQFLSQLFSLILIYGFVSISWAKLQSPWVFVPMLAIQLLFDILWSYLANHFFLLLNPRRKTLLVYRNPMDRKRFGSIQGKPTELLYRITDELQYDGSFEELESRLKGYDAIFVSGVNSLCRNSILKYCKQNAIHGFFLPHVGDLIMQEATHIQSFDTPVLYVNRTAPAPEYVFFKRVFDLIVSGLGLVILSPVMLITGLAIHKSDGGPVFYKQTRLTKHGREFQILKFRSMRADAEKEGVALLSTGENDERITPVGRIIRRFRIDELPQLWNIFVGDMSVVGPRPERPEIAAAYAEKLPEFQLRLQVKAGLTGYAQVYGKYNTAPYEKLEFDLLYINHMNMLTDLKLCFATLFALCQADSTEGYSDSRLTVDADETKQDIHRPDMI